jgi:hypothetical protein
MHTTQAGLHLLANFVFEINLAVLQQYREQEPELSLETQSHIDQLRK